MIVSLAWLSDYVRLSVPADTLAERLAMAGLNHESTRRVGDDTAIELEVTSNRPDCLGHVGIAREASAIFSTPLQVPEPVAVATGGPVADSISIAIVDTTICPYYQARVIRGIRVGPSPKWLVDRLATIGIASVNNVVDVTNYVMMECGQPLHAFDLAKIRGGRIVVRPANPGEPFEAINHRQYELDGRMCVIADAERPVALAGVMGGADSEISADTTELLLESAQFHPLAVRAAARSLSLMSDSSYRFERGPDPAAVDWAGRRAAAMILELAGGRLESGVAEAGALQGSRAEIHLADDAVRRVLGVDVAPDRRKAILRSLGFHELAASAAGTSWRSPSWRRDASREIDLVEEIARIEGYDHVPEDVPIPSRPVEVSSRDLAVARTGEVLVACGLCEAMTRSVVSETLDLVSAGWSDRPALTIQPALVRGAARLRRTLLPSLLESRGTNAAAGSPHGDLFEIARLYLPGGEPGTLPEEPLAAAMVIGGGYADVKGIVEAVLRRLGFDPSGHGSGTTAARYAAVAAHDGEPLFEPGRAAEIVVPGPDARPVRVGILGEVSRGLLERFGLAGPVAAAELLIDRLDAEVGRDVAIVRPSEFQAVDRDLNLVVDDSVPWSAVASAISRAAGGLLERLNLEQVWSDAERLGPGKKSLLVSVRLRSDAGTLSGDETRRIIDSAVAAARESCNAVLR